MPWRLIVFIVIGAAFLGFIGFNLENRCDVSFGFFTFSQVPVFLTTLSAFVLGMVLALPLVISFRSIARRNEKDPPPKGRGRKKLKPGKSPAPEDPNQPPSPDSGYGID
jgi:uncharacterized integral membrane protein